MLSVSLFSFGFAQLSWSALPKNPAHRVVYWVGTVRDNKPSTAMRVYTEGAIGNDLMVRLVFFTENDTAFSVSCQKITYLGGTSTAFLLQRRTYSAFAVRKSSQVAGYIRDQLDEYRRSEAGTERWAVAAENLCNVVDLWRSSLDATNSITEMSIPRFESRETEIFLSDYWNVGVFVIQAELNSTLVSFRFQK